MLRPIALLALVLVTTPALAQQDRNVADEADLHFQRAAESYRARNFIDALEHFLASNRLAPNRNVLFNIARSYEQLKRFPDAYRYYHDALEGEGDAEVRRNIEAALQRIAPNVAILEVETSPPGATIYVDRKDLGGHGTTPRRLAFAAGRYTVLAELAGYTDTQSQALEAKVGAVTAVRLSLERILGKVVVEGLPDTQVFVDNETQRAAGVVPCTLTLTPGLHTLSFARPGYTAFPQQVSVVASESIHVEAVLTVLTGSVLVSADERDAVVEIDGRPAGFTPTVIPAVPVGAHVVRITKRGFAPVERTVEVLANANTDLRDIELSPLRQVSTASRFLESADDAPSSVTVIDRQELVAFGYPTLAEALRGVRGVSSTFDGAYETVAIRGVGKPSDYGNRFLMLQDGMVQNDNIIYSSYIGFDGRASLGDIERIEIVRGPGSVLYGTGAVSGVVNLISREPGDTGVSGAIGAAYDGVARARAQGSFVLSDSASGWLSVSGARSSGFEERFSLDGVTTPIDGIDEFRAETATGRLLIGPVTLSFHGTSRKLHIPTGAYGTRTSDGRTFFLDQRAMLEARFDPKLSDTLQLFTRAYANAYGFRAAMYYDGFEDLAAPENSYDPSVLRERYNGRWLGAEARLVWSPSPRLRVTGGLQGEHNPVVEITGHSIGLEADVATPIEDSRVEYIDSSEPFSVGAAYAVVEGSPSERWRLWAGARADWFSTFGLAVNPRAAVIYKPTPRDVVKLMVGRAFRTPSSYEREYQDDGETQYPSYFAICDDGEPGACGDELEPESLLGGELEYTHRFTDDWAGLATVFANHITNAIDLVSIGEGYEEAIYVNTDEALITAGADLELRRDFRQGWMLAAQYGFLHAAYDSHPLGTRSELSAAGISTSKRLDATPQHFAGFKGFAPLVDELATLAARLTLVAPRRLGLTTNKETRGAVVADVVLSGHAARFRVDYSLGLYNAFDWRHSVPTGDSFASPTMPQRGRTLLLNVGASF